MIPQKLDKAWYTLVSGCYVAAAAVRHLQVGGPLRCAGSPGAVMHLQGRELPGSGVVRDLRVAWMLRIRCPCIGDIDSTAWQLRLARGGLWATRPPAVPPGSAVSCRLSCGCCWYTCFWRRCCKDKVGETGSIVYANSCSTSGSLPQQDTPKQPPASPTDQACIQASVWVWKVLVCLGAVDGQQDRHSDVNGIAFIIFIIFINNQRDGGGLHVRGSGPSGGPPYGV